MSGTVGQFPVPSTPFITDDRTVTLPWFYFLQNQYHRTGGAAAGTPPAPVPLGPTPFSYTAATAGSLIVSGGGVKRLTLTRRAVTVLTGSFYGSFPMSAGDVVAIDYIGAPTITFMPV